MPGIESPVLERDAPEFWSDILVEGRVGFPGVVPGTETMLLEVGALAQSKQPLVLGKTGGKEDALEIWSPVLDGGTAFGIAVVVAVPPFETEMETAVVVAVTV